MLVSKNPWDRVFALYKIFDLLSYYKKNDERSLDIWDRQLIKGIYSRSQHNYQHLQKDYESNSDDSFVSEITENDEES